MKIYHVQRDFSTSLAKWKKLITQEYVNVILIQSEGNGQFMIIAEDKRT